MQMSHGIMAAAPPSRAPFPPLPPVVAATPAPADVGVTSNSTLPSPAPVHVACLPPRPRVDAHTHCTSPAHVCCEASSAVDVHPPLHQAAACQAHIQQQNRQAAQTSNQMNATMSFNICIEKQQHDEIHSNDAEQTKKRKVVVSPGTTQPHADAMAVVSAAVYKLNTILSLPYHHRSAQNSHSASASLSSPSCTASAADSQSISLPRASLLDIHSSLLSALTSLPTDRKRKNADGLLSFSGTIGADQTSKRLVTAGHHVGSDHNLDADVLDDEHCATDGEFHGVSSGSGEGGDEDGEDGDGEGGSSRTANCKPCPLLSHVSKKPRRVLFVNVQREYTVSKRETYGMSTAEREQLVRVPVRIMGQIVNDEPVLYFVAKDLCLLIHIRKGNVAKTISQLGSDEKCRISVLCPRSNGTVSTHVLAALTMKGMQRLLANSRSPFANPVFKWLMVQVQQLAQEWKEERLDKTLNNNIQRRKNNNAHITPLQTSSNNRSSVSTPTRSTKQSVDADHSHHDGSRHVSSSSASTSSSPTPSRSTLSRFRQTKVEQQVNHSNDVSGHRVRNEAADAGSHSSCDVLETGSSKSTNLPSDLTTLLQAIQEGVG